MGVRIQELPETTGINKEDVLIVEDGQGTKKGTVQQLDKALGVSQLKEDLINVNNTKADKTDLAKTNLSLDALWKMNKGQTYDVLEQESKAYSVDVPSGAKYVGIDKVGGHSEVIDGEIVSSQTDRVEVASVDGTITQQITTGFPVLNSAGSVYDYIDLNEWKLHQRVGVVDLGTFYWETFTYGEATVFRSFDYTGKKPQGSTHVANIICSDYETSSADDLYSLNKDKTIAVHNGAVGLMVNDSTYTDATAFKEAMSGVMLYYELAEEIITDITIPTELTEWLEVEAGGSVTFHNTDDGKWLLIPNKLSFIRKLDEVV